LYFAPGGKALTLGLKKMVKFAEGEKGEKASPHVRMMHCQVDITLKISLFLIYQNNVLFAVRM
jgi:hypothetical protein